MLARKKSRTLGKNIGEPYPSDASVLVGVSRRAWLAKECALGLLFADIFVMSSCWMHGTLQDCYSALLNSNYDQKNSSKISFEEYNDMIGLATFE